MSKKIFEVDRNTENPNAGIGAYTSKPISYFGSARKDYVDLAPRNTNAIFLELGCGSGDTGELALREEKCSKYIGIELNPQAAEIARSKMSKVLEGDVENMELPFPDNYFDAVIISEVLEHLIDPWIVVRRLMQKVKSGGLVFASSPNISHYEIIRHLLNGRWPLEDSGTMDRTHMRWFTPSTFCQMFTAASVKVDYIGSVSVQSLKGRFFNYLTRGHFSYLTIRQINLHGRKL